MVQTALASSNKTRMVRYEFLHVATDGITEETPLARPAFVPIVRQARLRLPCSR